MTDRKWTGGCQCGAVRYELLAKPTDAHLCHCRMCQKQFGNFYAPLASVKKSEFRLTRGSMANFRSSADVQRGFCRDCGTPLTYEPISRNSISIAIPTLDDYSEVPPEAQYGIEARLPWVDHLPEIPAFISGENALGNAFSKLLPGIAASNRQHPDHDTEIWPPQAE